MKRTRHLMPDTWTEDVPLLRKKFPQADIVVHSSRHRQQAHGHQMAEVYLMANPAAELHLCHMQDNHLALRVELGRCPASWSFGHDFSDPETRSEFEQRIHNRMIEEFKRQDPSVFDGGLIFASAGNWDQSRRGRPHMDPNLASPQDIWRRNHLNLFLIAACDPDNGRPALFSGDCAEYPPDVAYPGERIPVTDPVSAGRVLIDGTSPAAAFAAGHIARLGITDAQGVIDYWVRFSRVAQGWERGRLHRKNGRGAFLLGDVV